MPSKLKNESEPMEFQTILVLAGVGAAVYFMYANYQRNKKKIVRAQHEVDHLYKHLAIPKPTPPTPVEAKKIARYLDGKE